MNWLKFGVYIHKTNGKLSEMRRPTQENDKGYDFIFDEGNVRKHPLLRMRWGVVLRGQGEYFFNRAIKNYEHLGEL